MGGTCSTYGERREVRTGFWWVNQRKRDRLEDPDIDGRVILSSSVKLTGPWMFLILSTTLVSVPSGYVFDPKRYWHND
jgi:hypothetical protein